MKNKKELTIRERLRKMDFSYSIDYDSHREQNPNHDEICKDDYCRCSTLHPTIDKIYPVGIKDIICNKFDIKDEKTKYCVERICNKLTDADFECQVGGGYYGEEMDGITLDSWDIIDQLEGVIDIKLNRKRKIEKLNSAQLEDEKIRKILIMEYGYLLDELKDAKFSIIEVSPNDIVFPSEKHFNELNEERVKKYTNHDGICGIVKQKNDKYKVIDGYHRIKANLNKRKIKLILAL